MSSHDHITQTPDQLEQQTQAAAANLLNVLDEPHAERDRDNGRWHETVVAHGVAGNSRFENGVMTDEALTHIIRIGDSTLIGVSRDIINLDDETKRPEVTRIRVSVLPFGAHAEQGASRTLLDVDPRELNEPREDGVIQRFETLEVGRSSIQDATGNLDAAISGKHMKITVSADGSIDVVDHKSTNGTDVLNEYDLTSLRNEKIRNAMIGFSSELNANPQLWSVENAVDGQKATGLQATEAEPAQDVRVLHEQQALHTTFWAKHESVIGTIDRAIEQAGYIDPSMLAYKIAGEIESVRQIRGLDAPMIEYLGKVIDLCNEVGAAGTNQHSEYHRNARPGLQKIRGMMSAITKE